MKQESAGGRGGGTKQVSTNEEEDDEMAHKGVDGVFKSRMNQINRVAKAMKPEDQSRPGHALVDNRASTRPEMEAEFQALAGLAQEVLPQWVKAAGAWLKR